MAIPDFQSLMLPLLRLAGDGKEHSIGETIQRLADESSLTARAPAHASQRPAGYLQQPT